MPRAFLFIACLCAMPWISQAAVSAAEQAEFLKVHNDYRRALANGQYGGPATDMQEITWDADLAAGAQAWADTCSRGHDSSSARQTASNKNSYVGQNAAWGYGTIAAAAAGWWDEYKCVNYGVNGGWPIGSCSCSMCGHFTQMAWSATTKIGCGINTACSMKTYFCNYYPGGNFDWGGRQDYVFRPGSSQCSQCEASGGTAGQACSNGLCSNGGSSGGGGSNPSGPSGPQPTPRPVAPQPTPKPTGRPTPRPVAPLPTVSSGACPTSFYGSGYRFSWWTPLLNGNQQLVEEAWNSIPYGNCFHEIKITYTPNISPGWYDKIDVRGTSGYFWGTSAMISDLKRNMAARKKAIEDYVKSRTGAAGASGQGSPPAAAASTEGCATTTTTGRSSTACSSTSEGNNNQNKPDVGLIVGVLIGAIAVCCLVAASAYYVMRKKKMIKDEERLMSEQEPYRPPVVM